jgi:hypothetical protein
VLPEVLGAAPALALGREVALGVGIAPTTCGEADVAPAGPVWRQCTIPGSWPST